MATSVLQRCVKVWTNVSLRRTASHVKLTSRATSTSTPLPEFEDLHLSYGHKSLHEISLRDPNLFWGRLAKSRLQWDKEFHRVSNCDLTEGKISWFSGGKLNVAVNCIDRHCVNENRIALIWEKDEPGTQEYVTYKQLQSLTNRIANLLKQNGVRRGDPVVIYMPVSPTAVAAMLACARIGAVHSVVFAGFSDEALATRINDAKAETVLTSDEAIRGGKIIPLKKIVDSAMKKCPQIKRVFVSQRTGADVPMTSVDIPLEKNLGSDVNCISESMDSEDNLFMLYTSGSTGKPKGVVHTSAGYLLYAAVSHELVFDYKPGEVFSCVADIGWITGHSYVVYGPLANGATTLLFESTPTYPDPGRYWEMVERLKINQLYLAPTALRLLLRFGDKWVTKYDRSSLKRLGCVGEPLNHEAWEWYYDVVGEKRCDIVDTWWQTETGGICLSPRPSESGAEIRPGMPMRPMFGIEPVLLDPTTGEELTGEDVHGVLCMKQSWPGIARTLYGDHQRFVETYLKPYPGYYFSGDGAHRHVGGYYQITGRMDDVINVSGHRLGTAEVEDVLDEHEAVAESAVVGCKHDIKGETVYAYVTLKEEVDEPHEQIRKELRHLVKRTIAGYAVPEIIQITPGLPKTRSGKIMRRILRKIAAGESDQLGDISTLADPSVVQVLVDNHNTILNEV